MYSGDCFVGRMKIFFNFNRNIWTGLHCPDIIGRAMGSGEIFIIILLIDTSYNDAGARGGNCDTIRDEWRCFVDASMKIF